MSAHVLETWRRRHDPTVLEQAGCLWGKAKPGAPVNLLVQHLLDTVAVAELMWSSYLAPSLRDRLDAVSADGGRALWCWLCGVHDVGKATPAFQQQVPELAQAVRRSGLTWEPLPARANQRWRHELASAHIVREAARESGWDRRAIKWVWPLQAGHHGRFCASRKIRPTGHLHGCDAAWRPAQAAVLDLVTLASGFIDLGAVEPEAAPPRAVQLAIAGLIIMADWIASNETHFGGVSEFGHVSLAEAQRRAEKGWRELGLRGGWGRLASPEGDILSSRFGLAARPSQELVVDAARAFPAPGLLVVEAPTGEGKTEAALAAAEALAARFGADGVFVGMPTQATSDAMFERVCRWVEQVSPGIQVSLLHGKRRFNTAWRELARRPLATEGPSESDYYGVSDELPSAFGQPAPRGDPRWGVAAAVEWLHGRKRGLLAPVVVGTIDQLLFAATRTKHVALRYAGLAGKVVILDEVHAADLYMSQFLHEALFLLGQGGVPVVLLSATLPPHQRKELVSEYLGGAAAVPHLELATLEPAPGYPSVTSAWADGAAPRHTTKVAPAWRAHLNVEVEVLDEPDEGPAEAVCARVTEAVADGGCVLVVHNTVRRALETFAELRRNLRKEEVVLLHGRLSTGRRATLTEELLAALGPEPAEADGGRPDVLVVVATQVAEQSFDVDVDLLVTDLAPIDLLLQRAGRLHRHARTRPRPPLLRHPRIVVTGLRRRADEPPWIPLSSLFVYGEEPSRREPGDPTEPTPLRGAVPLLRTAALVERAAGGTWDLPGQVPELVASGYGDEDVVPEAWRKVEAVEQVRAEQLRSRRRAKAAELRLAVANDRTAATLAGLHERSDPSGAGDEHLAATVRDGEPSAEVLLVRREGERYRSLDGRTDLGLHGEGIHDQGKLDAILAGTVRLPARPDLTSAAEQLGCSIAEWRESPSVKFSNVLVLDEDGSAELAEQRVRYDDELGLQIGESVVSLYPRAGGDDA